MVWEKLSRVFQNSTKVDEIQGTYRGMTIATEPDNWSHLKALSLPQLADFLLDAGCTSEFEVFPQAATLPQKEKTSFDSELTSPSSFYSKASKPGSALTLTGLAISTLLPAQHRVGCATSTARIKQAFSKT